MSGRSGAERYAHVGVPRAMSFDPTPEIDRARAELTERGVLAEGAPAPAVAANLHALATSPRRVRLSLAGAGRDVLGYWWTDGRVAGSVVRDGARCAVSAFGAPMLGVELLETLPDPVPGPGEVVIEVSCAALNFFDTLIIENRYQFKPKLPFTPGGECAGRVSSAGPGVDASWIGVHANRHGAAAIEAGSAVASKPGVEAVVDGASSQAFTTWATLPTGVVWSLLQSPAVEAFSARTRQK